MDFVYNDEHQYVLLLQSLGRQLVDYFNRRDVNLWMQPLCMFIAQNSAAPPSMLGRQLLLQFRFFNVGTSMITSISILPSYGCTPVHTCVFLGRTTGMVIPSVGVFYICMEKEKIDSEFCNLLQPFGGDYLSHTL